jgi:hypothetical protein
MNRYRCADDQAKSNGLDLDVVADEVVAEVGPLFVLDPKAGPLRQGSPPRHKGFDQNDGPEMARHHSLRSVLDRSD